MRYFLPFLMFFFLVRPVWSADPGTTGGEVLKLGVGARSLGMGEAATAVSDGVESLYWNPAGLGMAERPSVMFSYNPLVEDGNYGGVAFSVNLPRRFFMGAGFNSLSHGSIDSFDAVGNQTGQFDAGDQLGIIGAAHAMGDVLVGLGAKYIRSSIDGVDATAWAVDAGARVKNPYFSRLGHAISLKNLGRKVSFISQDDPLPLSFILGNSLEWQRILFSLDVGKVKGTGAVFSAGLEWEAFKGTDKSIFLRGGYSSRKNEAEKLSGTALGLGFNFRFVSVDYAWIPLGELGNSHAISLVWRIGK